MLQEQAPTTRVVFDVIASYLKKNVIDTVGEWIHRVVRLFTLVMCLLPWSLRYAFIFICVLVWIYIAIRPFASLVSYRRVARRQKER